MKRTLFSWVISVTAGIIVGGAGGFLALTLVNGGDATADSNPDGGGGAVGTRPGIESVGDPVESANGAAGGGYGTGTSGERYRSAAFEQELRNAVNEVLGDQRRTAIVTATERVRPAVVTVFVVERQRRRGIFDDLWADFFGSQIPGQVYENRGLGSGVIVTDDGYVVTNDHVVGSADEITVRLTDGREFTGVVVDSDPRQDLAVIKIDPPENLPVAELGDSADIMIGEWIIALGSPFGFLLQDPQPSVSVGVVSAVGRSFMTPGENGTRYFPSTIQTDAAINPGNSGGPLVNVLGEVVGINSFILSQSGGSVGIGFAIPINQVHEALDQIRTIGYIRKPWYGFETDDNSYAYVARYNVENERGAVVVRVDDDSNAERLGIKPGSLIVGINGERVEGNQDLEAVLLMTAIGETVSLEYYPYGSSRKRTVELTIEERPRGR